MAALQIKVRIETIVRDDVAVEQRKLLRVFHKGNSDVRIENVDLRPLRQIASAQHTNLEKTQKRLRRRKQEKKNTQNKTLSVTGV